MSTPVITSTTTGLGFFPGQQSLNYAGGAYCNTQKYQAATGSVMFPGLFVGRPQNTANWINATSLDQISGPTINNIIGMLSYSTFSESAPPGLTAGYGNLIPFVAGTQLNIFNQNAGFGYIFAGATIDGTQTLAVAATTTGSGSSIVYAGSLVMSTFGAGPVISLVGSVSVNEFANGVTYARGSLVPVSYSFFNR